MTTNPDTRYLAETVDDLVKDVNEVSKVKQKQAKNRQAIRLHERCEQAKIELDRLLVLYPTATELAAVERKLRAAIETLIVDVFGVSKPGWASNP